MTAGVKIQAPFEEYGDKTNFTFNVVHLTEEYCQQEQWAFIMVEVLFLMGWKLICSVRRIIFPEAAIRRTVPP